VDSHLVLVKGLGTVTTRGLTGGDTENLGRETNGTLNLELLVLGTLDKIAGDLFEVLDVARGQSDTDTVDPTITCKKKKLFSLKKEYLLGLNLFFQSGLDSRLILFYNIHLIQDAKERKSLFSFGDIQSVTTYSDSRHFL
jgi:hypothetical protein